jgi:predicted SnoaL-like aldol condensation-catalyzing enzyme
MSDTNADNSTGTTPQHTTRADDPATIVTQYLSAFYTGDFERARLLVTDDFSLHGPLAQTSGRETFFASAAGLRPIVRGHRLVRQWWDGPEVCSIYDVDCESPVATATVRMSEWHTVRGAHLATALVLFDSAQLRALMPQH